MIEYVDNNNYDYKVSDIKKAIAGRAKIDVVQQSMHGFQQQLSTLGERLSGARITCSLSVNAVNAILVEGLKTLGANVRWCAAAANSTDDEVAAAVANVGVPIFAWGGESLAEYWWCMLRTFCFENKTFPHIIVDENGNAIKAINVGVEGEDDSSILSAESETEEGCELVEMIYMAHSAGVVWHNVADGLKGTMCGVGADAMNDEDRLMTYLDNIMKAWGNE